MQDVVQQVRQQAIHDIWVALGRDHDSSNETVWPHQDEMRLPIPFVFEDQGVSLSEAAQDSVELIHAQYFDNGAPNGGALNSVTAFDLGDDFFYIVEFGGAEEILWAVTPLPESRDTFATVEQRWVERNMRPAGVSFPSDFEALDMEQPWMIRQLTEALMERGEAGLDEIWSILSDNRELESIDQEAVLAFWRKAVDHGADGPRTGPIPGLTVRTFDSPEFDQWLDTADLRWSGTDEPISSYTAHALRAVCFYLVAPGSFVEGR